ncbi:MAG TPA: hypothetical protein VK915_13490 [Gaiellaceae bacterium]|nr:hypothetical protein [Gaiellaceae bacterium]
MISTETHRHLIRERTRELIARAELLRQVEHARAPRRRATLGTLRLRARRRATRSPAGV